MQSAYVSSTQYASLDCQQLGAELTRVSRREIELYGQLKKMADNDEAQMGIGLILFWPTLFFLEGGDGPQAAEYTRVKGEGDAVEQVMIQKSCEQALMAPRQEVIALREIPKRLKKLKELYDSGAISSDEYQEKRQEIIGEI